MGWIRSATRQGRLLILVSLPLLTACGAHGGAPKAGSTASADPSASSFIALDGHGIGGALIGSPAQKVQRLATEVLGKPEHVGFSGCELGGPDAIYSQRAWTWGSVTLTFSNRATTARVVPGRFVAWTVTARGQLPVKIRLPYGLALASTPQQIRERAPLKSAAEGLPGTYDLVTAEGVTYSFFKPFRRVQSISLNPQICE